MMSVFLSVWRQKFLLISFSFKLNSVSPGMLLTQRLIVSADRGVFEILLAASGPRMIFTISVEAAINNDWTIVCSVFAFPMSSPTLTATFLDFFQKPYWCHELGLPFTLLHQMTKICYVLTSQRRMLNCEMSLQVSWNHQIIITLNFSTSAAYWMELYNKFAHDVNLI
jgi:hypothetical protein